MCFWNKKLALTHPEEPPDDTITMQNYNIDAVFSKWFLDYAVPAEFQDYWRNRVEIQVDAQLNVPAATWDIPNGRHLAIQPKYLNPGVIAHEQAHNSYSLLTARQKTDFSTVYTPLKNTNKLIKYLYSINRYGLNSDIEGHAEVYRYIGDKMPARLKPFYPRLFA
jgi:hypothetical protein